MIYDITNTSYWNEYYLGDMLWSSPDWIVVSSGSSTSAQGAGLDSTEATFELTKNLSKITISFSDGIATDGVFYCITTTDSDFNSISNTTIQQETMNNTIFTQGYVLFDVNIVGSRLVGVYFSRFGGDYTPITITKIEYEDGTLPVWTSYINATEYFN